jgi:mono/diheme cytochrome c family protein
MKKYVLFFILLGVVILVAYEVIIFYDTNFRYGRMWETPGVRPHEEPLLTMQARVVPFGGGEEDFRATPAEALKSPIDEAGPEVLKLGKASYLLYCAQCHGSNYDGNGTVGQSFSPLPTDLRSIKVQSLSDGVFFKEISYGVPDGRQPPLATTIAPMDRWRIVAHVRSLGVRNP